MQINPLIVACLVYTAIAVLIYKIQPSIFFDTDGNIKEFGVGRNQAVVSYPIFLILLGVVIYLVSFIYVKVLNNMY